MSVKVSGDEVDEDDETFTLTLSGAAGGASIAGATATGTIDDDDAVGLVVSEKTVTVMETAHDNRNRAAYTVALASRPQAAVVVEMTSADEGIATISPTRLTFNEANWKTAQTVTVTGMDDEVVSPAGRSTMISHSVSGGDYDGMTESVLAMVMDDDALGMSVDPGAWVARFGRTVTDQLADAVEARLAGNPIEGRRAAVFGQGIAGWTGDGAGTVAGYSGLAVPDSREAVGAPGWGVEPQGQDYRYGGGLPPVPRGGLAGRRHRSPAPTVQDAIAGASFAVATKANDAGIAAGVWGQGSVSGFRGRDVQQPLEGQVATGLLGADLRADRWTAGAAIGYSRGEGGLDSHCSGEGCLGAVSATLASLTPYAGLNLTDRLMAWGSVGFGKGDLVVKPEGTEAIGTGLRFATGAAGVRGDVVGSGNGMGLGLAVKADTRFTNIASEAARAGGNRLVAADREVWLVRVGIEGSRRIEFGRRATLLPSVELAARLDGGGAETGYGADIRGGLALADSNSGLSFDLKARGLLTHEAPGFREWAASAGIAWDRRTAAGLGLELSVMQSWGVPGFGPMDGFLAQDTLKGHIGIGGPAGGRSDSRGRLEADAAYGIPMFGDRYIGTPRVRYQRSGAGSSVWSVGWGIVTAEPGGASVDVGIEAVRRAGNGASDRGLTLRGSVRF